MLVFGLFLGNNFIKNLCRSKGHMSYPNKILKSL
jgi:hypothetical protein